MDPKAGRGRNYPTPLEWARMMFDEMHKEEWLYAKKHKSDQFEQYFRMKYADFEMACPFMFDRIMSDENIWDRPEMQLIVSTAEAQIKGKLSKNQADARISQTLTNKYVKPILTKDEPSLQAQPSQQQQEQADEEKSTRKKGLSKKTLDGIRARQQQQKQ